MSRPGVPRDTVFPVTTSTTGAARRERSSTAIRRPGGGWLIFAMPPAELAVHPTDGPDKHELYLMCDDIEATISELDGKGVTCSQVSDQGWGLLTSITLPGGSQLGLYQPRHPTAHSGKLD